MSATMVLDRLDRVKRTGAGRWQARCPAHHDRGPSLSIRELDDGRVLIHCFAGCEVAQVLGALDLSFADLHPERIAGGDNRQRARPERRPFSANDTLRCVAFEALVAACACAAMLAGQPFTPEDRARLMLAAERLRAAANLAGVS